MAKTKHYLLTYARSYGDHWAYSEAVCSGEHPLEWVARLRQELGTRSTRLVFWGEISKAEFDRFSQIVQA